MPQGEFAWSWYQHRVALEVQRKLKRVKSSIEDFANELDEDEAWLRGKFYGQAPADLGEMLEWALVLGVEVLPVIDEMRDIEPAARYLS